MYVNTGLIRQVTSLGGRPEFTYTEIAKDYPIIPLKRYHLSYEATFFLTEGWRLPITLFHSGLLLGDNLVVFCNFSVCEL
jgi:hypothetical protein